MIHLKRGSAPDFWSRDRVKQWTARWLEKGCDSHRWTWPQYNNRRINDYAREAMRPWHHAKCAFCEAPLMGSGEIEHFRSKTHPKHALAAFVWRNLFLICPTCNQSKGAGDHEGCLKPDRDDPTTYLWVNPISRRIEPRPELSEEAHRRARKTIDLYQLDRPELSRLYKEYLQQVRTIQRFMTGGSQTFRQRSPQNPHELLAQPNYPFSLMIKSLLEYGGSI